ncbi:hypothetical protein AYR62_04660 [Secundilactobacillus paracollinoides]|uniref:Uncharacterized protein n=1 Tax=Secundilactobacillus paracollinoides TaxID=240427 RepID=A0A1B2J068_9LACO|nr:YlbG family protein [Secundilactobacillus paracollinoides]ANZ61807.1 hypothetical protein AYR61_10940 [Secundilactobacillus paracollinoides]ANZ63444.1 hypothetical protein AYR62_04660 [Secundilactobacillus paracollinoides]ANZ67726.1 hypothetical protein AYR63_11695 [Secundilactobacillus paracollinoides]KRL75794.1 hypothetical protein FC17_GL002527 [Secundilactobacillus paracollinoides DSM 15502 = JCM 11969]
MPAIQEREDLVVYVSNLRQVRQLKRYGHVAYVSKRMRYAVIYVNTDQVSDVTAQLKELRFVKRIITSPHKALIDLLGLSGNPVAKDEQAKAEEDDD